MDVTLPEGVLRPMSVQMFSPEHSQRPLQALLHRPDLLDALVESVQHGVFEGIQARAPFLPAIGPGIISYLYCTRYLGENLHGKGFVSEEIQGQMRFLAPASMGSPRIRLTMCRADMVGSIALVHPKGPATRKLVQENAIHAHQLVLFTQEELDGGMFVNIWIFASLTPGGQLTVHVGVPSDMNESGNELSCCDVEPLG